MAAATRKSRGGRCGGTPAAEFESRMTAKQLPLLHFPVALSSLTPACVCVCVPLRACRPHPIRVSFCSWALSLPLLDSST